MDPSLPILFPSNACEPTVRTKTLFASSALILMELFVACSEYNPIAPRIQPPNQIRRSVSGPDSLFAELGYPTPIPVYVLQKDGTAWRLDPNYPLPKKNNPNHWSAFGKAYDSSHPAGRCTWVKKFLPS